MAVFCHIDVFLFESCFFQENTAVFARALFLSLNPEKPLNENLSKQEELLACSFRCFHYKNIWIYILAESGALLLPVPVKKHKQVDLKAGQTPCWWHLRLFFIFFLFFLHSLNFDAKKSQYVALTLKPLGYFSLFFYYCFHWWNHNLLQLLILLWYFFVSPREKIRSFYTTSIKKVSIDKLVKEISQTLCCPWFYHPSVAHAATARVHRKACDVCFLRLTFNEP